MTASLRMTVGTVVAFLALARPGFAQYASPPPPPPTAGPPAHVPPTPGDLPPPGPAVADLTPPEFQHKPVTTVCDGCRPCDSPAAWLFSAEYLLVRPRRRADDFAIVDATDNLTPEGRVANIGFDWSSGFRAGVGYRAAGSPWETWFTYTYLHAGGNAAAAAPPGGLIYPTLTRPGLVDTATEASGGNNLTYNVYDVDSCRRVAGDQTLELRVGFGARYTNIEMNQRAIYTGRDANAAVAASHVCFDGGGLTAGGEGRWLLPWGLSMFGRAKAGLVVGNFRNDVRETNNGGTTVSANLQDNYYATIPVLEMGTGVTWEYRNFRVSAGYEMTNWFNLVDSPTFTNDFAEGKLGRRHGDLSLEGLFLQMGVTY